jgi:large subunit ribosomal protein L30
MKQEQTGCLLAVRVRGSAGLRHQVEAILEELGLNRRNQAILLKDSPAARGSLKRAKDALFWGKASEEIVTSLLTSRSRLSGSERLTDAEAKRRFGVESVKALAKLLGTGDLTPHELKRKGLSTRFNLHPPKHGFAGSLRDPFGKGGELGFRAESLREIVERMI